MNFKSDSKAKPAGSAEASTIKMFRFSVLCSWCINLEN